MFGRMGFLAISGFVILALFLSFWRASSVISSTIAVPICGIMEDVFAQEDELPLAIVVVLGDGLEPLVDSSLSSENSGRVVIWDV